MRLKHYGVSSIRMFNATRLRDMTEAVILCDHSEPIAAMVPYALYLKWQSQLEAVEQLGEAVPREEGKDI